MKEFEVLISQRVYYEVTVRAETREEAEKCALDYANDLDMVEIDRDPIEVYPNHPRLIKEN